MSQKRKIHPLIAIVGLESAGKTTFVHRLKTGEFQSRFQPTIGYDLSIIKQDDFRFDLIDLGGHQTFRTTFWENFVTSCQGCIFVFDRSNKAKLAIAKEWLWKINEWLPSDANLAFFANKSDLKDTLTMEEIVEGLNLNKFSESPTKSFRIFETSSVTGINTKECWEWMSRSIQRRFEVKPEINVYAFELLDDRLEPIIQEIMVGLDKQPEIDEILQVFKSHSLKMIDALPYINIDNVVVHILRKGDYYGILYADKSDEQSIVRETGLTLFFESLSRLRRNQEVTKDVLSEIIQSTEWAFN